MSEPLPPLQYPDGFEMNQTDYHENDPYLPRSAPSPEELANPQYARPQTPTLRPLNSPAVELDGSLLRVGSSGQEVMDMQNILADQGYNVSVDGQFGPQTKAAVQEFQRDRGLDADGVVGPRTASAMNETIFASNNLDATIQAAGLSNDITGGIDVIDQTVASATSPGQQQSVENYLG